MLLIERHRGVLPMQTDDRPGHHFLSPDTSADAGDRSFDGPHKSPSAGLLRTLVHYIRHVWGKLPNTSSRRWRDAPEKSTVHAEARGSSVLDLTTIYEPNDSFTETVVVGPALANARRSGSVTRFGVAKKGTSTAGRARRACSATSTGASAMDGVSRIRDYKATEDPKPRSNGHHSRGPARIGARWADTPSTPFAPRRKNDAGVRHRANSKESVADVNNGGSAAAASAGSEHWCDAAETDNPPASQGDDRWKDTSSSLVRATEAVKPDAKCDFSDRDSTEVDEDPCSPIRDIVIGLERATESGVPVHTSASSSNLLFQPTSGVASGGQKMVLEAHGQGMLSDSLRPPPVECSNSPISNSASESNFSLSCLISKGCSLMPFFSSASGKLEPEATEGVSDLETTPTSTEAAYTEDVGSGTTEFEAFPVVWVTQQLDPSHGVMGFFRSDGTVGVLLKDKTRMYLEPDGVTFYYMERAKPPFSITAEQARENEAAETRSPPARYQLDFYPFYLREKVSALKHFQTLFHRVALADPAPAGTRREVEAPSAASSTATRYKVKSKQRTGQHWQHYVTGNFAEKGKRSRRRRTWLFRLNDRMVQAVLIPEPRRTIFNDAPSYFVMPNLRKDLAMVCKAALIPRQLLSVDYARDSTHLLRTSFYIYLILFQDGAEIMLAAKMRLITYIDKAGASETLAFHRALRRKDLMERIQSVEYTILELLEQE